GFLAGKFGEAVFLTWRQAPSGERNFIKTKCRIKNQHFVNNLRFCLTEPYAPTKTRLTTRKAVLWNTSHGRYRGFTVQS
ncbi:hypothetical protein B5C26_01485, partial [Photorhabdus luminescens]|uniref:hypothetical protein n=1 Tax=Photorhabdus luminescens TaxID=29488 RepID=UPI000B6D91E2